MKSKLVFLSFLLVYSHLLKAQTEAIEPVNCGSEATHQQSLLEDGNYRLEQENFQQEYKKAILNGTAQSLNGTIYTLPVVVHLVHGGEPLGTGANLTEDHVKNVLQQSTDRFRHTSGLTFDNSFSGVDTEIEFCLATTDPDGNYSTGVLRYYRPDLNIGTYNQLGDFILATRWDTDLYHNMYVMTDMTNASGVSFLNITAYQGGSTFWSGLIAHEVGHYLSLAHTFSGGCVNGDCLTDGDGVCDTPPKTTSGFTGDPCASPGNECAADDDDLSTNNPYRPVANGGLGDVNDMLENYMDYTGSCWEAFTQGQSAKMRLFIQNHRLSVANHATIACAPRTVPANEAGIIAINLNQTGVCDNQFTPTVTIKNYGSATLNSVTVNISDTNGNTLNENVTLSLATDAQTTINLSSNFVLNIGTTTITAKTVNPNGATDGFTSNDATYISATYLGSTDCATLNNCANFNAATANGPENTTLVNFSGSLPTLSAGLEAYVCVATNGDVGAGFEAFNILDEDGNSKGLTNSSGVDCSGASPPACFTITHSEYTNWSADGTITFTLNPVNTQINPVLCDTNIACVELTIPQGGGTIPTNSSGFAGHWQHEDPNTQSMPVTIIREANNQIFVHSFGKCTPTYCDWGEQSTTAADAQDGQIIVEWNQGFVIRHDTITLINATTIRRNMRSTYTDNSGRADQYSTFLMYKNDCVNHLDLYHVTGDTMTYWSANELTSNGPIQAGQNITFKGGQSITLHAGFHAKAGSNFTASIESCETTSSANSCELTLSPTIQLSATEDYEANGQEWTRYRIPVTNWQNIPDDLFTTAPNLPACGLNTNAARTWVNIYDASDDSYIYGFCGLNSSSNLQDIWFARPKGDCPPTSVYIKLMDRECEVEYRSNMLNLECTDSCSLALSPTITLDRKEAFQVEGVDYYRYYIPVSNWQTIPAALFADAPNLPPCGLNTNAARTWVNIYDAANDSYIYGFCALGSNSSLQNIWFAKPQNECPLSIYITLNDRACDKNYTSNTLTINCDATLTNNGAQNRFTNQLSTKFNYERIKEEQVWSKEGYVTINNDEAIVVTPPQKTKVPTFSIMPNPTSQLTKIILNQPNKQTVSLQIRNIAGKLMHEILTQEVLKKGIYHYEFDASAIPEGIYFVTIQSGHTMETQKLVIVE